MTRTALLVEKNKRRHEIRSKVRCAVICITFWMIGMGGFVGGILRI